MSENTVLDIFSTVNRKSPVDCEKKSGHGRRMKTASAIIDFVTQAAACEAIGVQPDAVRKAVSAGKLPASWYHTLERLAGRPLPRDVFTFKGQAK